MIREDVRDSNGNLLFYTEAAGGCVSVKDANGNLLGTVREGKTRDANGNLVVLGSQPGVLYRGPLSI